MTAALDTHPRATPLHQQLRDAMAPHLGRELAHERAAQLLSALDEVWCADAVKAAERVGDIVEYARTVVTFARWADYPRPSLEACAQATVAACGVLRMWADAPVMLEVV